jgi:hypothetical protein
MKLTTGLGISELTKFIGVPDGLSCFNLLEDQPIAALFYTASEYQSASVDIFRRMQPREALK